MLNMNIAEPYATTMYFDVVVVERKAFAGPIQLNESLKSVLSSVNTELRSAGSWISAIRDGELCST